MTELSVRRRLGRNVAILAGAEVAARALSFAVGLATARVLGPSVFGQVALAQVVVFFLAAVGDAGLTTWTQRQMVLCPKQLGALLTDTLVAQLLVALALCSGVVATCAALPSGHGTVALIYVALPYAVTEALSLTYVLNALERMGSAALVRLVTQFITAAAITVALTAQSAVWVVASFWLGQLAGDVLTVLLLRRLTRLNLIRPSLQRLLPLFRGGLPILGTRALYQYAFAVASFALVALSTSADVGIYNAANRPMVLAPLVMIVLITALLPEMVRRGSESSNRLGVFSDQVIKLALRASFAGAALISVEAHQIIDILYGRQYLGGAPVLAVSAYLFPCFCYSLLALQVFIASGATGRALIAALCAAGFATVASPIATAIDGIGGATASTLTLGALLCIVLAALRGSPAASLSVLLVESCYGLAVLAAMHLAFLLIGTGAALGALSWSVVVIVLEGIRGWPTMRLLKQPSDPLSGRARRAPARGKTRGGRNRVQ